MGRKKEEPLCRRRGGERYICISTSIDKPLGQKVPLPEKTNKQRIGNDNETDHIYTLILPPISQTIPPLPRVPKDLLGTLHHFRFPSRFLALSFSIPAAYEVARGDGGYGREGHVGTVGREGDACFGGAEAEGFHAAGEDGSLDGGGSEWLSEGAEGEGGRRLLGLFVGMLWLQLSLCLWWRGRGRRG